VLQRYRAGIVVETAALDEAVRGARSEYRRLAEGLAVAEHAPSASRALSGGANGRRADDTDGAAFADVTLPADSENDAAASTDDPEPVLLEGLQEATAMLAEGADINQVAQVVLETLYRAFGLRRIALCLRDVARGQYVGRLGFGSDVDAFLRALRFDERYTPDVFHVALKKQTDVHISDLAVGGSGHGIPGWYHALSPDGALLFLPLVVVDRPVGCILAEHPAAGGLDLAPATLRLVRALRNQLVLGLQLRRAGRE